MTDPRSQLRLGERAAQRWPWRRMIVFAAATDVTNELLQRARFDVLAETTRDMVDKVGDACEASRWPDAFPWEAIRVDRDDTTGFTRGVVRLSARSRRQFPAWPWQSGSFWKGFRR